MAEDRSLIPVEIDLKGKLILAADGISIGTNFKTLQNMRYTYVNPKSVSGMSKVNTTVVSTYNHFRSGIHFTKSQPEESHVLIHGRDSGLVNSKVLDNETAIGSQGDFNSTAIHTDEQGSGIGRFSKAPGGNVAYCNGKESMIWGGHEHWVGAAINSHDAVFSKDFTAQMQNNLTDNDNIMLIANDGINSDIEIGTIRPAQGFKFYVKTANTTSGAMAGGYILSGGSWDALTGEVDGTDSGGISMAQTGSITFTGADIVTDTQDWTVNTDEDHVDYTSTPPAAGDVTLSSELWIGNAYQDLPCTFHNIEADGTVISSFDSTEFDAQVEGGCAITYAPDNTLWVASHKTQKVYNIETDGTLISSFSTTVYGSGSNTPSGMSYASDDTLWLCEATASGSDKIFNIETDGTLISSFNTSVYGGNNPQGISYASDDTLWVVDQRTVGDLVYNIETDGTFISSFATADFSSSHPSGVSYSREGVLWYSDSYLNTIYELQTDGTLISSFDVSGYNTQPYSITSKYSPTGYIQTDVIDVGQTPPNNGTWTLSDTTPDDSTVTYVAWASDTGAFGGEETSIGAIVDQGTVSILKRYYRVKATLTANTAKDQAPTIHDIFITFSIDAYTAAKPQLNEGRYLYWYKFEFTNLDVTTAISQITADMAFQPIRDLWDGEDREIIYFKEEKASNINNDYTVVVYEDTYVSTNTGTFCDIGGLVTATEDIVIGFTERMAGINVGIVGDQGNDAADSTASAEYWNGTTWAALSIVKDGTKGVGTASFNASGPLTWLPASVPNEFMKVDDMLIPMYMYRIKFAATLGTACQVYYIGGIPAEKTIQSYKFPIFAHNRLMLCNNQSEAKNEVLIGAAYSPVVFNGDDSVTINLGNEGEILAGTSIYNQFGSELYSITAFFKARETWVITGDTPETYLYYMVSDNIGIAAPLTLTTLNIPPEADQGSFNVAVFQAHNNIYIFDGKSFVTIGDDIENFFDTNSNTYINPDKIADSEGFYDEKRNEWHWLFASNNSTDLDKEWVYDFKRKKWFEIVRGSGKNLQMGFSVSDANSNTYIYAGIDTGYLERLENGTTFDGEDIVSVFELGDVSLYEGSMMHQTQIRHINMAVKAKSNTSNSIIGTHYGDTSDTGTATPTISPVNADGRIVKNKKSVNFGNHIYHSLKFSLTTDDEAVGFEPLSLGVFYKVIREDL